MQEKKYAEIGANYRFLLGWRLAYFIGMLVTILGVILLSMSIYKDLPKIAWLIPLVASPLGLLLRLADLQTRELYKATIRAGEVLEGEAGGVYSELAEEMFHKTSPARHPSHSSVIDLLGYGSLVLLLIFALVLYLCTFVFRLM